MGSQSLGILSRVLDVTDVMICTGSTPAHGRFLAIISLEINSNRIKVRNVSRRWSCRVVPEKYAKRKGVGSFGVLTGLQSLRGHPLCGLRGL
jgi:hypothetical protein